MSTNNLSQAMTSTWSGKRYIPVVGDIVIGIVTQKSAEYFRVDIGSPSPAVLSNVAFNSASKRHRPNIKVGQCLVCHVVSAVNTVETEVSCEDPTSQKDWVTNEVYFGPLTEGGMLVEVPIMYSKKLVAKNSDVFNLLGQYLKPFESCVGVNGRAYIRAGDASTLRTVLIADILKKADSMRLEDLEELCKESERRLTE